MKKISLGILFAAALTIVLSLATAQLNNLQIEDDSSDGVSTQQKFILVSTLNTRDANREFDNNVALVQAQRQRAIELNNAIRTAQTPAAKEGLQQELDQVMAKLNENNQKMLQAYGFTLTRNYTRVIETSSIYMLVSDEEADQYEESQRQQNEGSGN